MYIHLTIHSAFSLQDGLTTPRELVQVAQSIDMPAISITDQNLLTGVIEFAMASKLASRYASLTQQPLHPTLDMEAYQNSVYSNQQLSLHMFWAHL